MKEIFEKETQIKVKERLKDYTDFKYMRYVANTDEDYFKELYRNQIDIVIEKFRDFSKDDFETI